MDLRSARRGAGFGALLWEPMKNGNHTQEEGSRTGWQAFTDTLWKYQWLQKRDESLDSKIRDCWYDLSQGVLDIVVKLFVLAQLRAIATGVERITPGLLQKVHEDELKPVHPMLAALRSKDPERIAEYSDLMIPDIDMRLLHLKEKIETAQEATSRRQGFYGEDERAQRLYVLLSGMGCESPILTDLIKRVLAQHPQLAMPDLVTMVLDWQKQENK